MLSVFTRIYNTISGHFSPNKDELQIPVIVKTGLCLAQASRRAALYTERELPQNLLQAFTDSPLTADDKRFIGRKEQLDQLLSAIEMWHSGQTSMLAIIGPQGCGISTFLQQIANQVNDLNNWHFCELTHRPYDSKDCLAQLSSFVGSEQPLDSTAELIDYINTLPAGIFAIDNGHFLSSRIMGSNQAMRIFGAVMVATQHRHLWILGCEEYAWRRLSYIYHADRYFTQLIKLSLFSSEELKACLNKRLTQSKISLIANNTDENTELSLLDQHLSTFYKLSNGKPDFAFFYLLASLSFNDEISQWDIQPVVQLDFNQLKQLINEELFTLAEIATHGQLSIEDHQAIFRTSHEESWLMLERLYHQCLLDRSIDKDDTRYSLVTLYSDVITRFLSNANFLY